VRVFFFFFLRDEFRERNSRFSFVFDSTVNSVSGNCQSDVFGYSMFKFCVIYCAFWFRLVVDFMY
jgi:hypothetical protein